uniref:Ty3-gypsy retrotransposon protein n=1 Tax=Panagrolaimus sp. ES5 TaxID=591445 RepID=A0AC34FDI1_9BILA
MNSPKSNIPNISIEVVLLTMMIEKLDILSNRIGEMETKSVQIQESFNNLKSNIESMVWKSGTQHTESSGQKIEQEEETKDNVQEAKSDSVVALLDKVTLAADKESEQVLSEDIGEKDKAIE